MGYTHYWRGRQMVNAEFAADVRKIIKTAKSKGISIKGGSGSGPAVVTERDIVLNGDAAKGEDYETFSLRDGGEGFDFCKTAREPYDAVVGAILLRQAEVNPEFKLSSDGSFTDEEDWGAPRALYESTFGKPAVNFE